MDRFLDQTDSGTNRTRYTIGLGEWMYEARELAPDEFNAFDHALSALEHSADELARAIEKALGTDDRLRIGTLVYEQVEPFPFGGIPTWVKGYLSRLWLERKRRCATAPVR